MKQQEAQKHEAKVKRRAELVDIMKRQSKCVQLTKAFLTDLGEQQVANKRESDKVAAMKAAGAHATPAVPRRKPTSDRLIMVEDADEPDAPGKEIKVGVAPKRASGGGGAKHKRQAAVAKPKPKRAAGGDADSFASDDSDLEARYANPFKQIFAGKKQEATNSLDEAKLHAILQPKFDEVLAKLENQEKTLSEKAILQQGDIERRVVQQWDDTKEYLDAQEKENGKLHKALDAIGEELRAKER